MNHAKKQTFNELINGDKPVLVDFYADWCGPCRMMPPILKEVKKHMGEQLTVIKIDIDNNPSTASRFQVRGVPTLILIKRGKVLWRQAGVVPAQQLIPILQSAIQSRLNGR